MESQPHKPQDEKVEWIVAFFSAIIVFVLLGFILHEAVTRSENHPDISIQPGNIYVMTQGFGVDATVVNIGDAAVSGLVLEARLTNTASMEEISAVTLDYLAAQSSANIGFVFTEAPDPDRLTIRVLGFVYP